MAIVHGTNLTESLWGTEVADTIYGYGGSDTIFGLGGNDLIIGGASDDYLNGGAGIDTALYTDSNGGVTIDLGGSNGGVGGGTGGTANGDILYSIENVIGSAYGDRLIGDAANNTLTGLQGTDDLKGGGGSDILSGGSGDDELRGGAGADTLYGGDGFDTLDYIDSPAAVTVSLISHIASGGHAEGDTFSGVEHVTGSIHADSLSGDNFWNRLDGAEGNDTLKGFGGEDVLEGGAGNDTLYGMNDDDTLIGSYGDDTLVGGTGQDTMAGHGGNDTYYVDHPLDVADEWVGGGLYDRVLTTTNYVLAPGSEIENLEAADPFSTADLELGGNEFHNILWANDGDNVLDGGGDADLMLGRDGNDTYYVDNPADYVSEYDSEGIDTVRTSVGFVLTEGSYIETLETTDPFGTTDLQLTGNFGNNQIIGNDGDNFIDGGVGIDQMIGRGGDDTYFVDDDEDSITENGGQGIDTVRANVSYTLTAGADVEYLTTTNPAGTAAINLTGNGSGNVVWGNFGSNVLNGSGGNDELVGLGGQDAFLFNTELSAANNVDVIGDFVVSTDRIHLENTIFGAFSAGDLAAERFVVGTAAQDASDCIIYNDATGALFYDSDGTGAAAAVQFAQLNPGTALTHLDFLIV